MSKEAYITKVVEWVRVRGYNDIRANTEGYQTPISYGRQQDSEQFIPDVTGKQFDQESYFEVILKTNAADASHLLSKLKLLSQLAAVKGGKLFLMSPRGHRSFAKEVLVETNIVAEVINLP
ncbi:hypothetical protein [Spirosoma flavum]|uniref:Uncharacterized protein n=1 Tax=Spirosoma flavum TaxID=2048557 RepID=A0ABW6AFE1_9BACT